MISSIFTLSGADGGVGPQGPSGAKGPQGKHSQAVDADTSIKQSPALQCQVYLPRHRKFHMIRSSFKMSPCLI